MDGLFAEQLLIFFFFFFFLGINVHSDRFVQGYVNINITIITKLQYSNLRHYYYFTYSLWLHVSQQLYCYVTGKQH